MGLIIVATPIGNPLDITQRAIRDIRAADYVIGEERKEVSKLCKLLECPDKKLDVLNEHSKPQDIEYLAGLCEKHSVILVSDCGTPSFYDPGHQLVKACRKKGIPVTVAPGASSLMTLIPLVSEPLTQFFFRGFIPAESEARIKELKYLSSLKTSIILMDTPYRLKKTLSELAEFFPKRKILIGLDLTSPNELVLEGFPNDVYKKLDREKAEFILLIY